MPELQGFGFEYPKNTTLPEWFPEAFFYKSELI